METSLLSILLVITTLWSTASTAKIPTYIQICSRNDPNLNDCVVRNGNAAIPHIIHGDRKFGVPDLDPLDLKQIIIRQGTKQVGLNLDITDAKMLGLRNAQFLKARIDLKKKHIEADFYNEPGIQIIGNYKASGKVLVLPVTGNGKANITIAGVRNTLKLDFELVKKKGKEYINFTKVEFPNEYGRVYMQFDNLFDGDKLLGENMNRFLNENWKEVFEDIAPMFESTIAEVFKRLLSLYFSTIPYDQLFPVKK